MKKLAYALFTLLLLSLATPGFGAEFTVLPDADADCADLTCSLESALQTAAANGEDDRIMLGPGTYETTVGFAYKPTAENYALTIEGAGTEATVLTGSLDVPILDIDTTAMADDSGALIRLGGMNVFTTFEGECNDSLRIQTNSSELHIIGDILVASPSDVETTCSNMTITAASISFGGTISAGGDLTLDAISLIVENVLALNASNGNVTIGIGDTTELITDSGGNIASGDLIISSGSGADISAGGSISSGTVELGNDINIGSEGMIVVSGPNNDGATVEVINVDLISSGSAGTIELNPVDVNPIGDGDSGSAGTVVNSVDTNQIEPGIVILPLFTGNITLGISETDILQYYSVPEGYTITLDAAPLSGENTEFTWSQVSGCPATLSDVSSPAPTFVTPAVNGDDCLLFFKYTCQTDIGTQTGRVAVRVYDNDIDGFPAGMLPFKSAGLQELGIRVEDETGMLISLEALDTPDAIYIPKTIGALPYGLFDFKVKVDPGAEARVTVQLPEPAPEGYGWFKYDPENGWTDYSDHASFNSERTAVILTLVDGGAGDEDGVANGIIHDPSGLAEAITTESTADVEADAGSGGGGCFVSALAF